MKTHKKFLSLLTIFIFSGAVFQSFTPPEPPAQKFPFKQAGLTERQAAAHLLNRFTYGPREGDIDRVVNTGLEKWFLEQLEGGQNDAPLTAKLKQYDALDLTNTEAVNTYPKMNQVYRMAEADGVISREAAGKADKREYRAKLEAYMKQKELKPQQELFRQFISQKILRAAYTNNQLQEMLTEFWFNHFNVALNKNQCAEFVPAYERDVIRPNVTANFGTLLLATAKSPAMLMYLDNFSSMGVNEDMPPYSRKGNAALSDMRPNNPNAERALKKIQAQKKNQGLNENYAREVMELHTLGVDGGYTQADVTQAARVLTGWTVYPMNKRGYGAQMKQFADRMGGLEKRGFVHDGDFFFAANRHDNKEKIVLGQKFPAGGGYEEGVKLLNMLAHHPSTARFISRKIAVRFVSDNPPQSLIDKMAKTFTAKNGNIRQVLLTMVSSPEFWSREALREKTKSPFELAISAVRALDGDINSPYLLYNWITRMGQKIYFYQAPTGFPDRGQYWINTGSLLNRMNFGLALASERIPGVKVNLASINKNREPESAPAALATYSKLIMPERDLNETIKRLTPMLNDPNLRSKVEKAAGKTAPPDDADTMMTEDAAMEAKTPGREKAYSKQKINSKNFYAMESSKGNNSMLAQVVGVIIGSPEFQRK